MVSQLEHLDIFVVSLLFLVLTTYLPNYLKHNYEISIGYS